MRDYRETMGFCGHEPGINAVYREAESVAARLEATTASGTLLYWLTSEGLEKQAIRKGCQAVWRRGSALINALHPCLHSRAMLAITMKL